MAGRIYLAFLNGYQPRWAATLTPRVAESFGYPAQVIDVDLKISRYYAPERQQYHATLMLARLVRDLPSSESKIVGIIGVDLFIPVLTFVFGQAQLDGPGALVSTHRLHNDFYGLPADEDLLVARTVKEVIHELGHAFGLVHCPDYSCVMNASTYVEEVDLKEDRFCSGCWNTLSEKNTR